MKKNNYLKSLQNILLVVISIVFTYIILEFGTHLVFAHLPQNFYNFQSREFKTLGQTSKQALLPQESYIAIIGDSYGAGKGDWFLNNGSNLNSRYQASHLIQDRTKQDIVSLSKAGAGNYSAAIYAINTVQVLKNYGFNFPDPQNIIVYFYEGNDFTDNLWLYENYYLPTYPSDKSFSKKSDFMQYMLEEYSQGKLTQLEDHFFMGTFLVKACESLAYSLNKDRKQYQSEVSLEVFVNDEIKPIADELVREIPLNLSDLQMQIAAEMFQESLKMLKNRWSTANIYVVYIPAPLSCYKVVDQQLAKQVDNTHQKTLQLIQNYTQAENIPFFDSTPYLKNIARSELIHGPKDWTHVNQLGYTALADFICDKVLNGKIY